MSRRSVLILGVLCLLLGGVKAVDWWTHRHLITLDAVNARLSPVLQEVARQSGIPVAARTNLTQLVTVHFRRTPVEEALNVLADQTEGRWERVYLMGRTSAARRQLSQMLVEKGAPRLITRSGMGGGMMFGGPSPENTPSTTKFDFDWNGKPLQTAALQLALRAQIPIMAEEAFNPTLHLHLSAKDFPTAVDRLARVAETRFQMVYSFHVWQRGGGDDPAARANRREGGETSDRSAAWGARQAEREESDQAQVALLSPEEQKRYQERQAERQNRRAEWAALTPEERQKRLEAMAGDPRFIARMEKRDSDRIRNLTPEQMAARIQRFVARHGPNS